MQPSSKEQRAQKYEHADAEEQDDDDDKGDQIYGWLS